MSDEKYRLMAEIATYGIYQVDMDGKLVFVNKAYTEIVGYEIDELLGKHYHIIIPDAEIPKAETLMKKIVSGSPFKGEGAVKHKLGHKVPVNISVAKMEINGKTLGVTGLMEDITDRKKAERTIRESEEKARALLNATTDIAVLMDTNGTMLAVNTAGAAKIGKSVDELVGTCAYDYFRPDIARSRKSVIDKVIRKGKALRHEDEYDGVVLDQNIYPMFDGNGNVNGVAIFLLDITESKRAKEDLIKREKELALKNLDLEEVNTTLRVLLNKRDEDRTVLEEKVLFSVKDLIDPYIEKLKKCIEGQKQKTYLDIIESNLKDIVSPFTTLHSSRFYSLTPTEVLVANLVKQGRSTKDIADIMNLCTSTIDAHRSGIRAKLGLNNKKVNLRTFLLSEVNNCSTNT